MKTNIHSIQWWVREHISSIAFAAGFVVDVLTLRRIDLLYENVVFLSYLLIAFIGIVLVHSVETRLFAPRWLLKIRAWLPVLVQFPLGGLFSGFVIFYTKSASFFTSWPFLLILLTLFVGNEFFRKRYERLVFQISIYYFALLSYLVLVTPVILGTIGTSTFVFAGILSLFIIFFLLSIIKRLFPKLYQQGSYLIWWILFGIFVGFNTLYFTNTIPPVPLAIKEIGVYHSVMRKDGAYLVTYESPAWYESWRYTSSIYHRSSGEAAYCFASVFAPTNLRAPIYHSWQWKAENGTWVRDERIPFTIEGGRGEGYRGYTYKQNLKEGTWRCVVETESKQVIGEVRFNIKDVSVSVDLVNEAH